jgi:hypothetical protein
MMKTGMLNRPLGAAPRLRRGAFFAFALVSAVALAGCANPNFIGLQDFGTINGNVVDQNGKPVAQALVSATGTTSTVQTQSNGAFNLSNVAVGEQTVTAQAAGYGAPATATVIVVKNDNVTAGNLVLTSVISH